MAHKTKLLLWPFQSSDLNPVEDEWDELKRRSCESEDLEWFWMKEWSLISCQVFSDLNPVEDEWTEEKKLWIWRSGVILDEGMVSDLVSGVLWSEPCRRRVRWTEEKKLWIWRSGVILDEGMVSDLVKSSQVTFIYIAPLTIQIVTKHCTISK